MLFITNIYITFSFMWSDCYGGNIMVFLQAIAPAAQEVQQLAAVTRLQMITIFYANNCILWKW